MIHDVLEKRYGIDDLNDQIEMLSLLLRRDAASDEEMKGLESAIDRFVSVATRRLTEEEEILKNSHSNDLATHFAQHRFFASQTNLLKIAFMARDMPLARSVVDFLRTWINYQTRNERIDNMMMVSNM